MKISHFARACSEALGSPKSFISAVIIILLWAVLGPFFHFSEAWQLAINSSTTIFTFLAMFLLQHSQNVDTKAVHLKLDELILKNEEARNEFVRAEKQEAEAIGQLEEMHDHGNGVDNPSRLWYTTETGDVEGVSQNRNS